MRKRKTISPFRAERYDRHWGFSDEPEGAEWQGGGFCGADAGDCAGDGGSNGAPCHGADGDYGISPGWAAAIGARLNLAEMGSARGRGEARDVA